MFGKKKEKKESSTSGGTSSYHETTSVRTLGNGSIITRQISSEISQIRNVTREERSHIIHSSTTGDFQALKGIFDRKNPLAVSLPNSSRFSNKPIVKSALEADSKPYLYANSGKESGRISSIAGTRLPNLPIASGNTFSFTSGPSYSRQQLAIQNPRPSLQLPANPLVPTYRNTSLRLGKALVINNVKFFNNKDERAGADKDSIDLEKLMKDIGFKVDHKKNLKGKDMSKEIKNFSKSNFGIYDISVIVVMSHGNNLVNTETGVTSVRGGFTQIAGIDNNPIATDEIIEMFTTGNCHPSLKGKPKIFIFQCCRGERDLEVCHDTVPIKSPPKQHSDMLIAYSTLPGYLSNRDPKAGTWYIQSICEVFRQHYKSCHVEEMLKIVDDRLGKYHPRFTQTSTYESRGFKNCFLFKDPS